MWGLTAAAGGGTESEEKREYRPLSGSQLP